MTTKCPHCGGNLPYPTEKQIEAYRLVRIHGFSLYESGIIMGVSESAVCRLLSRLKEKRPDLFVVPTRFTWKNTLSYEDSMAYEVKQDF